METLIPRLFTPPAESFFLFGPRGTGKSSWLKRSYPDALVIDLLDAETFPSYGARPERLKESVRALRGTPMVVVDEVQKLPLLLPVVHSLIEEQKDIQFILTGSTSRKLKRSGTDLLGGRALSYSMHPFIAAEMGVSFQLETALERGLIPLIVAAKNPSKVLASYAALYVREEVQAEGSVRNIRNFCRFLEALSFSHGQLLTISTVARECEVERKVVEVYVSILEDLLLSYRIPVFTKRARRQTVSHPKFFYPGFFNRNQVARTFSQLNSSILVNNPSNQGRLG